MEALHPFPLALPHLLICILYNILYHKPANVSVCAFVHVCAHVCEVCMNQEESP